MNFGANNEFQVTEGPSNMFQICSSGAELDREVIVLLSTNNITANG